MDVLMTVPLLSDRGGVAVFCSSLLPFLQRSNFCTTLLEIGKTKGKNNAFYPFIDQIRFAQLLRNNTFSLIHVNPSFTFKCLFREGMMIYRAKKQRIPVIVFMHGWDKQLKRKVENFLFRWIFQKTYGSADAFIVLASLFKRELQNLGIKCPIYKETTAVDDRLLENFSFENKQKKLLSAKTIKLLFLARIVKRKGCFETVDAVRHLIEKGYPVSLTIAGQGPDLTELQDYIDYSNTPQGAISVIGYIEGKKKIDVFTSHHIYCLPTFAGEGLPISVLEAMAFGMPVVTCPVGGLNDFFQDKNMGYFVSSNDPKTIVKALESLIIDRDQLQQIALFNHQYIKQNYMMSQLFERLTAIYVAVLSKKKKY